MSDDKIAFSMKLFFKSAALLSHITAARPEGLGTSRGRHTTWTSRRRAKDGTASTRTMPPRPKATHAAGLKTSPAF